MKIKSYLIELSLAILGVLIALLIDNIREEWKEKKLMNAYLNVVVDDLNDDILNLDNQLKIDSGWIRRMKILKDVVTTNQDLPTQPYSLNVWTESNHVHYRKLNAWDSLDLLALNLYGNTEYKTRKIGFSMIINSGLSHQLKNDILQKITIYYTTDSDELDLKTEIDHTCMWNAIPELNKYQGSFKAVIDSKEFNSTWFRNEVSGRYNTTLNEMKAKLKMRKKAEELILAIKATDI